MKFRYAQTSFSAGEIAPEMYGRTDTAKHQNGLKEATNANITSFGGISRRNGTRYIHKAKYNDKKIRLIKFVYNVDQSYILEMGEKYIRFYSDGAIINAGGAPYEVQTPYTEESLADIKFTQREDTMFFTHEDYPVLRLLRYANDNWVLDNPPFDPVPFEETTATPVGYLKFSTTELEEGKSFTATTYADEDLTQQLASFTSVDVGARISVNSGVITISSVGTGSTITGTITYKLSSVTTAIPYSWTLLHSGWSDSLGWPSCVFMHQQRLIFAASKKFPRKIWMSTTGNPFNFDTADNSDDDALSVGIDDNQGNKVVHLAQDQVLLALTAGNEFSITGGAETGIKSGNITIRLQSAFGCSSVRPVNIDASLFFIQRAKKQVKAVTNGGYYGTEVEWATLSEMSKHMFTSGIVDMAYQQDPTSLLYIVCGNGDIAILNYSSEQEIVGWCRLETEGKYLSVCSIPEETQDTVYVAVARANGVFIELFEKGLNVDSAVSYNFSSPTQTLTGLEHLVGATVDILADDAVMKSQTVPYGGVINLEKFATNVTVGLGYTTTVRPLFQDTPNQTGSLVGKRIAVGEYVLRFHNTRGAIVRVSKKKDGVILTSSTFGGELLDRPSESMDSSKTVNAAGWNVNECDVEIIQKQPLPLTILALSYSVTVND